VGTPRVAVLGAGTAGLAAATTLQDAGCAITVYEAGSEIGGLTRSFDLWGFRVDLGSHIYSEERPRADALWYRVIGPDHHRVVMRRAIVSGGRLYRYPLEPLDAIHAMGARELLRVGDGYLRRPRASSVEPESSEAWMTRRWGRPFVDDFFRGYAEKLLGIPCDEVDAAFARGLFGTSNRASGLREAVRRLVGARPRRRRSGDGTSRSFPHPTDGSGTLTARLARDLARRGADIRLSERVTEVGPSSRQSEGLQVTRGDHSAMFDGIVSSLPLPALARCVPTLGDRVRAAARRLRVRSTILVYLDVRGTEGFPEQWRYLYDRVIVGRVANVRRWWPAASQRPVPSGRTVLCAEIWCAAEDALWLASDDELATVARSDLVATRVLSDRDRVADAHVERLRGTHPIPHLGIGRDLLLVREALGAYPDLVLAGRHATFGMADQGEVIETAIEAAERLLAELHV
jgi:protoporphyrinogen oxidase